MVAIKLCLYFDRNLNENQLEYLHRGVFDKNNLLGKKFDRLVKLYLDKQQEIGVLNVSWVPKL